MWCDVSVREMWCDGECCTIRHGATEMQNARCEMTVWNVVSWYVECCTMQDVESYDVM